MNIKIKKLSEDATTPTLGSEYAAGHDLYAHVTSDRGFEPIESNCTVKIGTGVAMEIPNGMFGAVFARSGLATKEGLRPANCVGVIDSDYRGEVIVAIHNDSDETRYVANGDRIAQIVIVPYVVSTFVEVDSLNDSERGLGGFGHTGK